MKKIMLVAVGFIALSSFTTEKKVEKKAVTPGMIYYVTCGGKLTGAFMCSSCDVQATANAMCGN